MGKLRQLFNESSWTVDDLLSDDFEIRLEQKVKDLMLDLTDKLTMKGELDALSIDRLHPNGIIDPIELRQEIEAL